MKSGKKDMFLATTGRNGFYSHYGDLVSDRSPYKTFIIKGSSGSGKGTTIAMAAAEMLRRGYSVELIHCASDPESLDGAICPGLSVAIVDGTAPHVTEPSYPLAREKVFSVYDCIDPGVLTGRLPELMELSNKAGSLRKRAARFVAGAAELLEDIRVCASPALCEARLKSYADGLCQRLMPKGRRGDGASVQHRFALAVTPDGVVDYMPSNMAGYPTRIVFSDGFGPAAELVLGKLRDRALNLGFKVTLYHDPIFPERLDGVAIEDLGIIAVWDGPISDRARSGRGVHLARFYGEELLRGSRERTRFCRRSAISLLDEAAALMAEARDRHMQLEEIYKKAMNYKLLKQKRQAFINSLFE